MKIYDLVKSLLVKDKKYRNSDRELLWEVWELEGSAFAGVMRRDKFLGKETTTPESITRARRMVQEKHPELGADPEVKKARDAREEDKGTFVFREEIQNGSLF